jgi:hypothetical protein
MELTCIKCGEQACIQLDLSDGDTFRCPECEQDFTLAEVEQAIGNWQKVIAWVKLCPARRPQPDPRDVPAPDPIAERIMNTLRGE